MGLDSNVVLCIGSNTAGRHGMGAALFAKIHYGAKYGIGRGRTGNTYCLPTKDFDIKSLPLEEIQLNIEDFIAYTKMNPDLTFIVTKVACGLAGFASHQIAPMFLDAPDNCLFDKDWAPWLPGKRFFERTAGKFKELVV